MAIQPNDTLYKEVDVKDLFNSGNTSDSDATIIDLLEKNKFLSKEFRELTREQEIQSVRLCEVTEQKKKDEEDKIMAKEDKRQMATRLEVRPFDVQKLTKNQLDMMN